MIRNLIAAFAAPSIAALAIGVSGSFAAGAGAAYGGAVRQLSDAEAMSNARAIFDRADLDGSESLSADEFSALALVTAELARLNGFVPVEIGGATETVALPAAAPSEMSRAERVRIEAVARAEFYAIAGEDGVIGRDEFARDRAARFARADRNRNGALSERELVSYAVEEARLASPDA
ncbi:MAG: hypothetical protein AB7P23_00745 [Amphiplicatus sp.]